VRVFGGTAGFLNLRRKKTIGTLAVPLKKALKIVSKLGKRFLNVRILAYLT